MQPPVITPETGGGNGYVINAGHRRVKQAIAAGLEEIDVLVDEAANDNGAMRSMIENIAREALNPVDQWRAIERLVALGWTEEAIGVALALPVRQIRKLRLLANVLPAMLDHMAKGDMPDERQLRTIASASLDEQKEVWKKHKPSKADPQVSWWSVAQALTKARMYARHASFGDDLAQAYGIQWVEDLFAPADEDSRYTTDVEAFLGAQQEWMTDQPAEEGHHRRGDELGRGQAAAEGRARLRQAVEVATARRCISTATVACRRVHYRMPAAKKPKGKGASAPAMTRRMRLARLEAASRRDAQGRRDDRRLPHRRAARGARSRADRGRHADGAADPRLRRPERLGRSGSGGTYYGNRRLARHAAALFDRGRQARPRHGHAPRRGARRSSPTCCRAGRTAPTAASSPASPAMSSAPTTSCRTWAREDFLSCLSRAALEGSCKDTPVLPRQKVKDTRAALVEHFKEGHFVHPAALFAPDKAAVSEVAGVERRRSERRRGRRGRRRHGEDFTGDEAAHAEAFPDAAE